MAGPRTLLTPRAVAVGVDDALAWIGGADWADIDRRLPRTQPYHPRAIGRAQGTGH